MAVVEVSDQTFEREVVASEGPVLVELYLASVEKCVSLSPVISRLELEFGDRIKFVRVDLQANPAILNAFQVSALPWVLLFHGGQPVEEAKEDIDEARLREMLKSVLPQPAGEIEPAALAQLLATGKVLPVDVRDPGSYGRYRIPGAIHQMADAILAEPETMHPSDGRLRVLYGRSTDEAKELSEKVRERGVEVAYLKGGFLHWEADGLDVERG